MLCCLVRTGTPPPQISAASGCPRKQPRRWGGARLRSLQAPPQSLAEYFRTKPVFEGDPHAGGKAFRLRTRKDKNSCKTEAYHFARHDREMATKPPTSTPATPYLVFKGRFQLRQGIFSAQTWRRYCWLLLDNIIDIIHRYLSRHNLLYERAFQLGQGILTTDTWHLGRNGAGGRVGEEVGLA